MNNAHTPHYDDGGAISIMVIIIGIDNQSLIPRLFAFHFMLMPLGKVLIHTFPPHLWVNSRADMNSFSLVW